MTLDNAYKILELSPSCKDEEINKAFKKLAKKHHPDKGGNPENFKLALEAKEVLIKRNETTYNIGGRTFTKSEYDSIIREYYRQAAESLNKLEKELEISRTLFKIRMFSLLIFIVFSVCNIFLKWNWTIHWTVVLLFWITMLKTEKIYNLYLRFKMKK